MDDLEHKNNLYLSAKIMEALSFASKAHDGQTRKGPDHPPYICHPAAVGMILWKAGYEEDITIAGILHDVIEDTSLEYTDIENQFGKHVADLVAHVSEDTTLPHDAMRDGYLDHLETAPNEAKAISAADLLANRYDMFIALEQGRVLWKNHWKKNIERDLRRLTIIKSGDVNPELIKQLESVTAKVHQYFLE